MTKKPYHLVWKRPKEQARSDNDATQKSEMSPNNCEENPVSDVPNLLLRLGMGREEMITPTPELSQTPTEDHADQSICKDCSEVLSKHTLLERLTSPELCEEETLSSTHKTLTRKHKIESSSVSMCPSKKQKDDKQKEEEKTESGMAKKIFRQPKTGLQNLGERVRDPAMKIVGPKKAGYVLPRKFVKMNSHGLKIEKMQVDSLTACAKQDQPSNDWQRTYRPSNDGLNQHPELQDVSRPPNGEILSKDNPSIYTMSSRDSIYPDLCRRAVQAWEDLRSMSPFNSPLKELKLDSSGKQLGQLQSMRRHSFSPIGVTNCSTTGRLLSESSPVNRSLPIHELYSSMRALEGPSEVEKTVPFSTLKSDNRSLIASSNPTEQNITQLCRSPSTPGFAIGSTPREDVGEQTASINIDVDTVNKPAIIKPRVRPPRPPPTNLKPKYMRYNQWYIEGRGIPGIAKWSETAEMLPRAPKLPNDHPFNKTIRENPTLFKIATPLDVELFEFHLLSHPNDDFVESICRGFTEGFWPWAPAEIEGYPMINDQSVVPSPDEEKRKFLVEQKEHEREMGRYSESFEGELLPGMYCMPVFAVPKGESSFRLVTHQSYGQYSLNSITPSHEKAFPLDNMVRLGDLLIRAHQEKKPDERLTLWKCDVSEAYRLLPVHFLWQLKQIVTIDGLRYVDRCVAFGGKRSGDLYIAFMSLVLWIAENVMGVENPSAYCDDSFGIGKMDEIEWYEPYGRMMSRSQTRMLDLWDQLRIPHKEKKQLSGETLTIIGIEVDANALTLTLPNDRKQELVDELSRFIFKIGQPAKRRKLREYQTLAGWINWALNVFPLLRPGLSNLYNKLRGLSRPQEKVKVTRAISNDLEWLKSHIQESSGVHIITARNWSIEEADFTAYADACLTGMGFWIPNEHLGFYAEVPYDTPSEWIYFREMWAVLSVLCHAVDNNLLRDKKIIIYTDNTNTRDAFNTLAADPIYNNIMKKAADLLIASNNQLRVLYIEGELNIVADALSRHQLHRASSYDPKIRCISYLPPRDALGAGQQ